MHYAVIMAGGAGTRLWPLSRATRPKQLLTVGEARSLLRVSYDRVVGVVPPERVYVCVSAAHRDAVRAALPDLPHDNVLGEPCGRDTANAVGFPAAVLHEQDPDAIAAFVTSDHLIEPVDVFQESLRTAFALAVERPGSLVTFGVVPAYPHTGLGYIERGEPLAEPQGSGGYAVAAFKEKPDQATAESYVASGRYYWNSGMFVWRCDTVLAELATHLPEAYGGLTEIASAWRTPSYQQVLERVYPSLPRISIDYAVLEPAARGDGADIVVVPLPVDWLDVGSWPTLAETLDRDTDGNARAAMAVLVDSAGNIVVSDDPEHLVATVGLRDMIVVHTGDATMVCPRSAAERVKELATVVRDRFGATYH
ncbi:MAG TPA: mannose-1-phosphate guanylyltransferase [Mycobacteriales bacterium]